jgi:predicted ATP-binding protein involved in virulence
VYKINSIQFYEHPVLGDHKIKLADSGEEMRSAYISLIIGGNGTGKSKALIAISEVLNYINDFDPLSKIHLDFTFKIEVLKNPK